MPETRKLAAILFADVVGYSRLMGEDESGTARAVREHREAARPIVASHGGRIVRTIGDGLLLEFPSVVAAVECAIAIQKLMVERNAETPEAKRILYRIGVNLGDVLIEGDDVVGDGVNIAARLESICEPGGIFVSDSTFGQVRGQIDAHFVDLGEKALKNIARPVRVFAINPSAESSTPVASASKKPGPPRLSIVVLPFANMSGDPEQEYFADGVTESLTTDLSRISGAFVIGRSTAFSYKGKSRDLRQIGRELDVRYVLEGSVQRSGNRIRVNVQLVDAETGSHIWTERFDKPIADLFDMQDEIVSRLANRLGHELAGAEARRAGRSATPDSMDHYFLGLADLNKGQTTNLLDKARFHFDCALDLDPDNVDALVGRARVNLGFVSYWLSEDRANPLGSAELDLGKALKLRPDNAIAQALLGVVRMFSNRAVQGIAECGRALEIDRNLAAAHAWIGLGKYFAGRCEETEGHILEALRVSPRDTRAYAWMVYVGIAKIALGCDEEAVAWLNRSIELNPNNPVPHFFLGAALSCLGRPDEARDAARAGLELNPGFTIARFRSLTFSDNAVYRAQRERVYKGMRMAGMPEGDKKTN
jgi:TolB-like protein/class 3 adenylate cyclase/Flp pilus assembly protein TadD